jgi:hypothetical protein
LAEDKAGVSEGVDALMNLKMGASKKRGRQTRHPTGGAVASGGTTTVRRLKDIGSLTPDEGTIVNKGHTQTGVVFPTRRSGGRPGGWT